MRSALLAIAGIVIGAAGYAAYRGDLGWQRQGSRHAADHAAEKQEPRENVTALGSLLPEQPLSLTYRENPHGRGYIAEIHNTSPKQLAVLVELKNPALRQVRAARLELAPGELREIGQAQGWNLASGETIRIRQDGFRPISLKMP